MSNRTIKKQQWRALKFPGAEGIKKRVFKFKIGSKS